MLAIVFHVFLWPLISSVLMVCALVTPACQDDLRLWLALSGAVGFVAATPLSLYAAKASKRLLS
ncbi:MAG: hypothetical protein ACLPN5_05760 [Roseiarcus sp.]